MLYNYCIEIIYIFCIEIFLTCIYWINYVVYDIVYILIFHKNDMVYNYTYSYYIQMSLKIEWGPKPTK